MNWKTLPEHVQQLFYEMAKSYPRPEEFLSSLKSGRPVPRPPGERGRFSMSDGFNPVGHTNQRTVRLVSRLR